MFQGFPGGAVVKNLPAKAGDSAYAKAYTIPFIPLLIYTILASNLIFLQFIVDTAVRIIHKMDALEK